MPALRLGREPHVLADAQARKKVGELERASEAEPRALRRAQMRDVLAVDHDGAVGGGQLPDIRLK